MPSQLDKDWQELQEGEQGTNTGSNMNRIGLDAYEAREAARNRNRGSRAKPAPAAKAASAQQPASSSGPVEFSIPAAVAAFLASGFWIYDPIKENHVVALVSAAVIAALAGRFYKVILALAAVVAIALAFDYFDVGA